MGVGKLKPREVGVEERRPVLVVLVEREQFLVQRDRLDGLVPGVGGLRLPREELVGAIENRRLRGEFERVLRLRAGDSVTLDGIGTILLVPGVYLSLNILEEYIVLPLVVGRRLMLNPVVVFVWLVFWTWLWSVPGALMAVPLLAIVKIICDHFEPLAALAEFIEK